MYGFVYRLINLENSKAYIGQTTQSPEKRKINHLSTLRNNTHKNSHLQNSFNKYGEDVFKFEVLNWGNSKEELDKLEIYYIKIYNTLNSKYGFNLKSGGANGKHSIETRKKMSEIKKRDYVRENHPAYGTNHSLKTKFKMSNVKRRNCHYFKKGCFGFVGATYVNKKNRPWRRVWQSNTSYMSKFKSLGYFEDPLSAQIVHNLVTDEIMALDISSFEEIEVSEEIVIETNNIISEPESLEVTGKIGFGNVDPSSYLKWTGLGKAWFLMNDSGEVESIKLHG